jgi:signal transduction histidine kinase
MTRDETPRSLRDLLKALSEESWARRVEGLQNVASRLASGEFEHEQQRVLADVLEKMLADPKWEVRKALAIALSECQIAEVTKSALDVLSRDANHWVRHAAVRALRRVRERERSPTDWTLAADIQDPMLQHIVRRTREIGLRSMTPALIHDLAMEISEQSYRELAADTAHEVRTLVTPLEGYLVALQRHLASKQQADERATALLSAALDRLQHTRRFTDDLRTYSSPGESGFVTVEIASVVADAVGVSFEHPSKDAFANIHRQIDVPRDLIVEAIQDRLTRAVANIVRNSLQAMPGGGTLRITSGQTDGKVVELIVSDTGHGMSAEMLEQARLRFRSTRRDQGGTGLGLPIAERIVVVDHGGELLLESEEKKGTTVTIRIPVRRVRVDER